MNAMRVTTLPLPLTHAHNRPDTYGGISAKPNGRQRRGDDRMTLTTPWHPMMGANAAGFGVLYGRLSG